MPGQTEFKIPVKQNVKLSYDYVITSEMFNSLKNKNPKFSSLLAEGSIIRVFYESGMQNLIHVIFPSRMMHFSVTAGVFNALCETVENFIEFLSSCELCLL